jgi:hypothetical protein
MGIRHFSVLLVPLLTAGLIAGCASGSGTGTASPSSGPGSASGEPTAPSPAVPSPAAPSPSAGDITLSGPVEAGVEPGCLLLRANGRVYLLTGGDTNIVKAGSTVTVRGHVVQAMSHCMQGEPFQVTEAHSS